MQNILYEHESWVLNRGDLRNQLETLKIDLSLSIFWSNCLETLGTEAKLNRASSEKALEYLAAETESIMLALEQYEETQEFLSFLREQCPRIAAYLPEELETDEETVYAKGNDAMDAMEENISELKRLISLKDADLEILAECLQSGDWSRVKAESVAIAHLPTMLPYPDWEDEDFEELYYWKSEDGKLSIPTTGDEITRMPDGGRIIFKGVERSDLLEYRDYLTEIGVDYLSSTEKEGEYTVIYQFAEPYLK